MLTQTFTCRINAFLFLFMLLSTQIAGAAKVFFLSNGQITAFDGGAARSISASQKSVSDKTPYFHLFDWKNNSATNRFLISTGRDHRFRPDSDATSGVDLWLRDDTGAERQLHSSVYRARFSPDGRRLVYTTSDCELRLEDTQGHRFLTVSGAYNPQWKNDGSTVVFEKIPIGRNPHKPDTLHLAKINVINGKINLLTDGSFDDVRPEFHPSGKWILFVSGGRSGFASFWKISTDGGEPEQLTNIKLKRIDETFVPTPYQNTIWSADGRWFVYDFKNGDVRQTWGLEFNAAGKISRRLKLADGLFPQWLEDGKTFAYLKQVGEQDEPAVGRLP